MAEPNSKIIIDALRKARKYIRTVEAVRLEAESIAILAQTLKDFTEGGEVKAIENALEKLDVIC